MATLQDRDALLLTPGDQRPRPRRAWRRSAAGPPRLGQSGAGGRRLAAAVLPGQQPVGEREVGQQAEAEVLDGRHHLALDVPLEQE